MNHIENETPKFIPSLAEPPRIVQEIEPPLHTTSYIKGYQDGFAASDNSSATVFLSGCGMLALLLTCVVLIRYASRLANTLLQNGSTAEHGSGAKRLLSTLLPLLLCVSMAGCAAKTDMQEPLPPVPLPPPVSYTHLDVYKRQALDYVTRMDGTTGQELNDLYARMVGAQQ